MPKTMRAAYIRRYGDNEVVCVGPRRIPRVSPRELRIEVHAACVNPRDWLLRDGRYVFRHFVVGFPKVLGSDVSGVVRAVGAKVVGMRVGDEVVAMQTTFGQMGGYAEQMVVNASAVGRKSNSMSFAEAAGLPVAGLTALQALRDDARVRGDERVVVLGASGGVGHYAVQIAKYFGAEVVGVCSEPNHAFVRELGCDHTIDYRSQDTVAALTTLGRADIVFDAIGKGSLSLYRPCMRPGGRYISTVPTPENARDQLRSTPTHLLGMPPGMISRTVLCKPSGADLDLLASMADEGALRTHIDAVYSLCDVREALTRSRTQRARGKIILEIEAGAAAPRSD